MSISWGIPLLSFRPPKLGQALIATTAKSVDAIADWVGLVIVLVVVLSGIKRCGGDDGGDNRAVKLLGVV
jgi:hypothetical protein